MSCILTPASLCLQFSHLLTTWTFQGAPHFVLHFSSLTCPEANDVQVQGRHSFIFGICSWIFMHVYQYHWLKIIRKLKVPEMFFDYMSKLIGVVQLITGIKGISEGTNWPRAARNSKVLMKTVEFIFTPEYLYHAKLYKDHQLYKLRGVTNWIVFF